MPTGRVIGEYWKDFNRQVEAGQINPLLAGIASFTPGPAIGNFYSNVQQGNVPGAIASGVSAAPWMPGLNAMKGFRFGPAGSTELQRLIGASGSVPVVLNRAKTGINFLEQKGKDYLSEFTTDHPIDLSFGSGKGN